MQHVWKAITGFFAPVPLEAEEHLQQARFLRSLFPFIVGVAGFVVFALFARRGLNLSTLFGAGLVVFVAVLWRWLTPKSYRLVSLLIALVSVLGISGILTVTHNLYGPGVLVYFMALLFVGLTADSLGILLIGGLSEVALLGVYTIWSEVPPKAYLPITLYEVAGLMGLMVICTLLLALGTHSLLRTYARLQAQRDVLAQRVALRTAELRAANATLSAAQASLAQRVEERTAHLVLEIEQRQKAETALRQGEADYRQLIECLPQALLLRRGTRYTFANPAALRLLGVPDLPTMQQLRPADFVIPEQHLVLQARQQQLAAQTETTPRQEYQIRTYDGHVLDTEVSSYPVVFEGQPTVLTVCSDITARKQAEHAWRAKEAAEAASHAKSAFLASMSHELRTPLTAIIGYAELILGVAAPASRTHLRATRIWESAQRLLTIINDVLDFSKLEAGKLNLHYVTFDVTDLVAEVLAAVEPVMAKNQNALHLTQPSTAIALNADRERVRQILYNLLHNAAKFTQNGSVYLTVQEVDEPGAPSVVFTLTDTGIGIAQSQLAQLFQPFQQANEIITRKYGGPGLGLVISRLLCLLHGGEITVHSVLAQGTTFTVRLPLAPPINSMK